MFEKLKSMDVLSDPNLTNKPIQHNLPEDSLFNAVRDGDTQLVLECLENDFKIHQQDVNGCTPLTLCILDQNKEIFDILLSDNQWGIHKTYPFHMAAVADKEGYFIKALIEARVNTGVKIDQQDSSGKTALTVALEEKNVRAVEILIKSGARVFPDDYELLEDDLFSSVHERCGVIKTAVEETSGSVGFAQVLDLIKQGHCVVLHYHYTNKNAVVYNVGNPEQENRNAIYVDVNPLFPVLSDDDWLWYIQDAGYEYSPYNHSQTLISHKFENVKEYAFGYNNTISRVVF